MSSVNLPYRERKLHLLVISAGPRDTSWAEALIVRLSKNCLVETRAIVDDVIPRINQTTMVLKNQPMSTPGEETTEFLRQTAFQLIQWADLMVCVPLDADGISKMISGIADSLLSVALRSWNPNKSIFLVPGMSTEMWSNPLTNRQLDEFRARWRWVRIFAPITWEYSDNPCPRAKKVQQWKGFKEVLAAINNRVDLVQLGNKRAIAALVPPVYKCKVKSRLPPELWTQILDYTEEWELAQALGIFTHLPMPWDWTTEPMRGSSKLEVYEHELQWKLLTCDSTAICKKLSQAPTTFHEIPTTAASLIIQFNLIDVLRYIELNRPDLFSLSFGGKALPNLGSFFYLRTQVLDYWRDSCYFRSKHEYSCEPIDGASRYGYIEVLEWWWRHSGLPLIYTESALEEATAEGHIDVLQWWCETAAQDQKVVLRPGYSLLRGAQEGQVEALRWWHQSGISVGSKYQVPRVASRNGHIDVLEAWRRLEGDDNLLDPSYDKEILVGPTVGCHTSVLDWWLRFARGELEGMKGKQRVHYRKRDIEEALGRFPRPNEAKRWWSAYMADPKIDDAVEWLV